MGDFNKREILRLFSKHVSSGKAAFYRRYRMPFVMGARSGSRISDMDGRKTLLNLHCNGGVFNLGHRNKVLINELMEALQEVDIGNHHLMSRERALTAEALSRTMPPGLDYVVFGSGGGEAIDTAIKVARAYTGRREIISFLGGYHGHTGLALAAGDAKYREPFLSSQDGFRQIPLFDLPALRESVSEGTAACMFETIPATLGMPLPPSSFYAEAARICRDAGTLLIMDEVQTGLGRTGRMWGFQHFNVEPDIVVVGKGLSGGIYPITATVMRSELDGVFRDDPFIHISTFGGAEPGCRVARRVLEITDSEEFSNHVEELSRRFAAMLGKLQKTYSRYFLGFRQLGLMIGLEFADSEDGLLMSRIAYANDLLMVYANNDPRIVQMLPPLVMDLDEVEEVGKRLDHTLRTAARLKPVVRLVSTFRRREERR